MKTKGLIRCHFYVALSTCRMFLLIVLLWAVLSAFLSWDGKVSSLPSIMIFIGLFSGVPPLSVYAVGEASGFGVYALALPYSRRQIVFASYIFSLLTAAFAFVIVAASQLAGSAISGSFSLEGLLIPASLAFAIALLPTIVSMPLMFRLGAEKGRIAYLITIGAISAISTVAATSSIIVSGDDGGSSLISSIFSLMSSNSLILPAAVMCISLLLLLLSCAVSVLLYRGRDL